MKALLITLTAFGGVAIGGCDNDRAADVPNARTSSHAIDDDKIEASLAAAQQYLQSDEIDKAEAIVRTLVDRAPAEPRGHEMLGQIILSRAAIAVETNDVTRSQELRKQAWSCYREAARLQPDSAGIQHSAGQVALMAEDAEGGLQCFLEAGRLDPGNPQHPLYAAQVLLQQRRLDEAEQALQRVLELDANEPYAHASLAMVALERGQSDQALAAIGRAREVMPDDVGLRAQHAKIHRRTNEPRRALELLLGLHDADRAEEAVAFEIAAAWNMLGDPKRAAQAWEHSYAAHARSSNAGRIALHIARMHLKANDLREAMRWAESATGPTRAATDSEARMLINEIQAAMPPPVP